MNDQIVLDVLFGLIVLLFAAIGFWRGVAKEAVVTAGILAGAELADRWAEPWGGDLFDLIDIDEKAARLVVAAIALLSATIILGYGGSAVIGAGQVGLSGRLAGAALSAVNGALLLHYGLAFIEEAYLDDESTQRVLDRSDVSRLLLREFGWFLIGAAAVSAIAVLVGLALTRRSKETAFAPFSSELGSASRYDAPVRQRHARLPRGADEGKYEPDFRGYDPGSQRYAADVPRPSETIPLPPVEPTRLVQDGVGGWERAAFSGDEWYRRAQAFSRPGESPAVDDKLGPNGRPLSTTGESAKADATDPGVNGHTASMGFSPDQWGSPGARPEASSQPHRLGSRVQRLRQCHLCLAELGELDSFCPRCGAAAR